MGRRKALRLSPEGTRASPVVAVSTSDPPQRDTAYQNKQIDENAEQERDGPSDVFGAG
jgi:hypothetical protein